MSGTIAFTGCLGISDGIGCGGCSPDTTLEVTFPGGAASFDAILQTQAPVLVSSTTQWGHAPLTCGLETLSFLYLALLPGYTIDLLIGAPPSWVGVAGTFPTGFVGGETFAFNLLTYNPATGGYAVDANIAVVFTAGAQSAVDVSRAINAQLALVGYPPLASVVAGQLVIKGTQPGQDQRIAGSTFNATIGYPNTNTGANGTGVAQTVTGLYLSQFNAIPAENVWLKGEAWLNVLVGGA